MRAKHKAKYSRLDLLWPTDKKPLISICINMHIVQQPATIDNVFILRQFSSHNRTKPQQMQNQNSENSYIYRVTPGIIIVAGAINTSTVLRVSYCKGVHEVPSCGRQFGIPYQAHPSRFVCSRTVPGEQISPCCSTKTFSKGRPGPPGSAATYCLPKLLCSIRNHHPEAPKQS